MNIITCVVIALISLGIGWFVGNRKVSHMEELSDNIEQATHYLENLETPQIDEMNQLINEHRDTVAQFNVDILMDIENNNADDAKEKLVRSLIAAYESIEEDALHEMTTESSQDLIQKIEALAKKYPSFKKIISASDIQ